MAVRGRTTFDHAHDFGFNKRPNREIQIEPVALLGRQFGGRQWRHVPSLRLLLGRLAVHLHENNSFLMGQKLSSCCRLRHRRGWMRAAQKTSLWRRRRRVRVERVDGMQQQSLFLYSERLSFRCCLRRWRLGCRRPRGRYRYHRLGRRPRWRVRSRQTELSRRWNAFVSRAGRDCRGNGSASAGQCGRTGRPAEVGKIACRHG